jgi:hypothetical protein
MKTHHAILSVFWNKTSFYPTRRQISTCRGKKTYDKSGTLKNEADFRILQHIPKEVQAKPALSSIENTLLPYPSFPYSFAVLRDLRGEDQNS